MLLLLILSVVGLLLSCAVIYRVRSIPFLALEREKYQDIVMEVFILQEETIKEMEEKKLQDVGALGDILFEGYSLPYDEDSRTFYLSQSIQEEPWKGRLTLCKELRDSGYVLVGMEDDFWYQKIKAVKENHVFTLWIMGVEDYYPVNLVVSGMPVMSIQTRYSREPEEIAYEEDPDQYVYGSDMQYFGDLIVFDPDKTEGGYRIVSSGVKYHEKGLSSRVFPKKSYALELLESEDKNYKTSLLGMREDDDWKLNSLYTDVNRIREKTASQIWEGIDEAAEDVEEAGPRMEYVEVILDNVYQGVYTLVEPVDAKKCGLKEQDVLYKIINWNIPSDQQIQESVDNNWRIQSSVRIRYPKMITDYKAAWSPMQDYLNLFYYGNYSYETAMERIDLGNIADYFIFLNVTSAVDNYWKNVYYSAYVEEDGSYKMILRPWDLDYTFGSQHNDKAARNTEFSMVNADVCPEAVFTCLFSQNRDVITGAITERWAYYREDFLSTDVVTGLMQENMDYLVDTGAIHRENDRWPEGDISTDIDQLIEYQINRMEWVDALMMEWSNS